MRLTRDILAANVRRYFRALARNILLHPFIVLCYKVTEIGKAHALVGTQNVIFVMNHESSLDGPLLTDVLWSHSHIRGLVWHEEWRQPHKRITLSLFDAIVAGSPKHLPLTERHKRRKLTIESMIQTLTNGDSVAICPEGSIGDGKAVSIPAHYRGVHDVISAHPETPVILVTLEGLDASYFGKSPHKPKWSIRRLPISVHFQRVDNVSTRGGTACLNRRLEQYWNDNIPLEVAN